jgi:hypothetical protein
MAQGGTAAHAAVEVVAPHIAWKPVTTIWWPASREFARE